MTIVSFSKTHGLCGLLYKQHPNHRELEEFHKEFSKDYPIFCAELIRVIDTLSEARIEAIPYKGPVLGQLLYDDPLSRHFSDLDIYISKSKVITAVKILEAKGWKRAEKLNDHQLELVLDSEIELPLISTASGVKIEIHWSLTYQTPPKHLLWPNALSRASVVSLAGRSIKVLNTEDRLIMLILHGAKHHWSAVKWIYDLDMLIQKTTEINWSNIREKLRAIGAENELLLALAILNHTFKRSSPIPIPPLIKKHSLTLCGSPVNHSKVWLDLKKPQSFLSKLKRLCGYIFKPRQPDIQFLTLPKPLYFLYSIVRPARLILKPLLK